MTKLYLYLTIIFFLLACEKENKPMLKNYTSEIFWLRNKGVDMPALVEGNTASKIFILFLHGGPSDGTIYVNKYFSNITDKIEKEFAMVYWDQRGIGESLGKIELKHLNRLQYLEDLEKLIELLKYRYGDDIQLFLMGHSWGGVLGQSYLVKHPDEEIVKGWIEVGSFHSILEMKKFGKERLKMIANEQIQKGKSVEKWKEFIKKADEFCADCSNSYQHLVDFFYLTIPAEEQAEKDGEIKWGVEGSISSLFYVMESILENEVTIEDSVISDFSDFEITNELYKITVPSLFLFGKYDIHVPIELAFQAKENYGTSSEDFYIEEFQYSDHSPMACEPELFQEYIIKFVNIYKTNK